MLLAMAAIPAPRIAAQPSYRTVTASRVPQAESGLDVHVEFAAGKFTIRPDAGDALYRVSLVYDDQHFEPVLSYDRDVPALEVGVTGNDVRSSLRELKQTRQQLDVALSPAVPVRLFVELGAANAELSLGGLSVREASIETGASRTTVRFAEPNRVSCDELRFELGAAEFDVLQLGNARCATVSLKGGAGRLTVDFGGAWSPDREHEVSVEIGLGGLTLRFPRELGVTVDLDRFLVAFDSEGFTKRGSRYVSTNYQRAGSRVALHVKAAIGTIDVEWY
jgi:hypothetical protein